MHIITPLSLCLDLEAQIPSIDENFVDQINQVLVEQWNLLNDSFLCRVPATKEAGSQRHAYH
jgi:hypothetical protein